MSSPFTRPSFTEPEAVKLNCSPQSGPIWGPTTMWEPHFTPRYRPWRQRIAFVPDGDFLGAIRAGKASVVTDQIERFTRPASF